MRVWIVEDQDRGDNAATPAAVFDSLEAARAWMADHGDEAFGYYALATPLGWDGSDESAGFEVMR